MASPRKGPQPFLGTESIDAAITHGIRLLNDTIVFNIGGSQLEAEIIEVEPYNLETGSKYKETFDKKERQPGEIMLTWGRGNPMLNIVVGAGENRKVVYIRKFRLGNREVSLKSLFEALGVKKQDIEALDGQKIMGASPEALIRVLNKPSAPVSNIRVETGSAVNSLGIFKKEKPGSGK